MARCYVMLHPLIRPPPSCPDSLRETAKLYQGSIQLARSFGRIRTLGKWRGVNTPRDNGEESAVHVPE